MPTLVPVELTNTFEYWRTLTNNLVSWANIGVYANGTPTANGANVVIVGDLTSTTVSLRDVNPIVSFKNVANTELAYMKYDVTANAFLIFSTAANASLAYYANGSLQVNAVPVVTTTATQNLTNKTLYLPVVVGTAANVAADFVSFRPSDTGAGKPYLAISKTTTANVWQIKLYDGAGSNGTIDFASSNLTFNSVPVVTLDATQTLTNKTLTTPTITSPNISVANLSGNSVAETASPGSNSTQIATTAFVAAAVASGGGAYQPLDAGLTSISGLTTSADKLIYTTALDTYAVTAFTAYGRSLVDDADAAAARTTLGLGTISTEANTSYFRLASAQTVSGATTWTVGAAAASQDYIKLSPSDMTTGKPYMAFSTGSSNTIWNISLFDGTNNNGTINFVSSGLTFNGVSLSTISATQTLTNKTLTSPTINTPTISGGTITGITDLAVADGGTGASDAATARTNLGLVIGTNVQAYDSTLAALAGVAATNNQLIYANGTNTFAATNFSAFGRTLVDDADAATARTTLGLAIGTNVQAYFSELQAIGGLVSAADRVPYFTGAGTASLATFTATGRSIVAAASATAAADVIGLGAADTVNFGQVGTLTTKLSVGNGGTGAANAASARTNFGLGTAQAVAFDRVHAGGDTTLYSMSTDQADHAFIRAGAISQFGATSVVALALQRLGSNGTIQTFYRATTQVGSISVTGSATAFNTSSDRRLKNNITDMVNFNTISPENFEYLDDNLLRIASLRPVSYRWNSQDEDDLSISHGFIADEIEQIIPSVVTGTKDGYVDTYTIYDKKGNVIKEDLTEEELSGVEYSKKKKTGKREEYQQVDYSKLTPYLTAATQSLTKMLLDQKKIIDDLQARIEILENKG